MGDVVFILSVQLGLLRSMGGGGDVVFILSVHQSEKYVRENPPTFYMGIS